MRAPPRPSTQPTWSWAGWASVCWVSAAAGSCPSPGGHRDEAGTLGTCDLAEWPWCPCEACKRERDKQDGKKERMLCDSTKQGEVASREASSGKTLWKELNFKLGLKWLQLRGDGESFQGPGNSIGRAQRQNSVGHRGCCQQVRWHRHGNRAQGLDWR